MIVDCPSLELRLLNSFKLLRPKHSLKNATSNNVFFEAFDASVLSSGGEITESELLWSVLPKSEAVIRDPNAIEIARFLRFPA